MSTKQSVIFAFMVLFLGIMLTSLGMWFHFSLELDIKKKTKASLEERKLTIEKERDLVSKILKDPDTGLEKRLEAAQLLADEKERKVHTDPDARKRLYEQEPPKFGEAWKASSRNWAGTYQDWKKRNNDLVQQAKGLKDQQATEEKKLHEAEEEMKQALKKTETDRKDRLKKRKEKEDELETVRVETEDVRHRIHQVSRELEKTPEEERDGEIVYSAPDLKKVTVNLGYQHGAKSGLRFKVFSAQHNIPVLKGEIQLSEVRAVTSDALILSRAEQPKYDPVTGWEATDPRMRYSIYHAEKDIDAVELIKRKTKREMVEELRQQRIKEEQGSEAEAKSMEEREAPGQPGVSLAYGEELLSVGDWISNTSFVRVLRDHQFQQEVVKELISLKDVNTGTVTLYVADAVRPYRRELLRRLCLRNQCQVATAMSPDVDYIVTTRTAARIDLLEKALERFKNQEEVPAEVAQKRNTLLALKEGDKYGSQILYEDDIEAFFVRRARKSELTKGKAIQPGQATFYVVGTTRLRSIEETGKRIQELGGHLSTHLDESVDYIVVGAGLHEAKLDITSGKVYPKDQAPEGTLDFYEAVRKMGWKVLREDEVDHFFGRE